MPEINIAINARGAVAGAKKVNTALGSIATRGSSLISKVFSPMTAAIAGLGGAAAIVGITRITDQFTVMASQLEYVTGSAKDAAQVERELLEVSKLTGTAVKDNADSYVKLSQAQKLTGLNSEQNIKVIGALNGLMVKTGTSGAQASAAMLQLSQALTSGKLQGDEFRSMAENAPGLLNAMGEAMGIAREDLKAMSSAGELTSEKMGKALLSIAESGEISFDSLPKTVAKGWNAVVIAFQDAWNKIDDETGIMGQLHDALQNLATWIENNTYRFSGWIQSLVDYLSANWPYILSSIEELWNNMRVAGAEITKSVTGMIANLGGVTNVVKTLVDWINTAIKAIGTLASQMKPGSSFAKWADYLTAGQISGAAAAAGTLSAGGSISDAVGAFGEAASAGQAFESGSNIGAGTTVNITTPVNKNNIRDITNGQIQQAAMI